MRLFVFLNPTNKRGTKTAYTDFRKELMKMGFLMVQPEVYMRVISSRRACDRFLTRMYEKAPPTGRIVAYKLTENQFSKTLYITGEKSAQERVIGSNSVIVL
ncbi:MAG: CRISPR-associated endonuclease Cas2 [Erysipelotrichaceae bacterium]|nr:CRISPR-associated endonuclease Cas2 [Erysipelotrichaceae bacterium]